MNLAKKIARENNETTFIGKPCKWCGGKIRSVKGGGRCIHYPEHRKLFPQYIEYETSPERLEHKRWNKMRQQYGIDKDEWYWMYKEQGGKCLMCEEEMLISSDTKAGPSSMAACIDHDHKTMRVRGMLCNNCNLVLGHAMDDVTILNSAIIYLEETTGINDI